MKIAIITLPLHTNYGGILQAFALETFLKSQGHEVCHIEERHYPKRINPILIIPKIFKRLAVKVLKDRKARIFSEHYYNKSFPIVTQNTLSFVKKHINLRIVNSFSDVNENDYDAIIVGSDQVWRPYYYRKIEKMFLSFTKGWNIRRIAYAASFGTDVWEYTPAQTERCKELLKSFNLISVREASGTKLVKKHLGFDAIHVLDPTMLLNSNDYAKLLDKQSVDWNSYSNVVMQYVLDENETVDNKIANIAEKNNLVVKRANSHFEDFNAPIEQRVQPPVEQWLNSFVKSCLVVTDSFHATVFSILFHRPFYVLVNKKRGASRIESLLKLFGLESRIVNDVENFNSIDWSVNWNLVDDKLNRLRKENSLALLESLKD